MAELQSQSQRTGESWNGGSSRAAGLYGELPALPCPVRSGRRTGLPPPDAQTATSGWRDRLNT